MAFPAALPPGSKGHSASRRSNRLTVGGPPCSSLKGRCALSRLGQRCFSGQRVACRLRELRQAAEDVQVVVAAAVAGAAAVVVAPR